MKFMQSLHQKIYGELRKEAITRGITVQELIRSVIIPSWIREKNKDEDKSKRTV